MPADAPIIPNLFAKKSKGSKSKNSTPSKNGTFAIFAKYITTPIKPSQKNISTLSSLIRLILDIVIKNGVKATIYAKKMMKTSSSFKDSKNILGKILKIAAAIAEPTKKVMVLPKSLNSKFLS